MIAQRIWDEIESQFFAATLGVVSTPRAFDEAMLQHSIVSELMANLSSESDVEAVAKRLQRLLNEPSDVRYCHQHDLAIAVYLRALDICAPEHALAPANLALTQRNLWWGKAMAKRIAGAPNRGIPFSWKDFEFPVSSRQVRVFVRSVKTQASPPLPISEMPVRSPEPGLLVAHHTTDAGGEFQDFSIVPLRIRTQSSVATQ